MSIRVKVTLVLVIAVAVPLAVSVFFWSAKVPSMVDADINLRLLLSGQDERFNAVGRSISPRMQQRNQGAAGTITLTAERLTYDLSDLLVHLQHAKCLDARGLHAGGGCRQAVYEFLDLYKREQKSEKAGQDGDTPEPDTDKGKHAKTYYDLDGLRISGPGIAGRDVVRPGLNAPRRRVAERALAGLESESGDFTLRPVATAPDEWILVTRRSMGPRQAQRATVWGTFEGTRRTLDQSAGGVAKFGLAGPDGRLLFALTFVPRAADPFEVRALRPERIPDVRAWLDAGAPGPVTIEGHRFSVQHARIEGTSLRAVHLTDLDDTTQFRFINSVRQYLKLGLALLVVAVGGGFILAGRMTGRLRRLGEAAEELGGGNLDADIGVTGRDEIGRLAERFRVMAGQLREHITTLEEKVDERTHDLRLKAEELGRANEDLVRLTKLKSDFLARMSHELRTPLNSIIGFSELLMAEGCGPVSEEQRDALERVMRNGKNLLQLINDILDISKIEADRLTLKYGTVELRAVVDNALSALMLRATEKKIALTAAVDPGLPALYTDEVRVLQILNNLLSNAVKFTEKGGVTLTARRAEAGIVIAVQDTGIGIAADDVPKLFTEFYQTDTGRARKYEGTGLGLAITRRLAEALGGGVTVTSEAGIGSTFTVTLPLVAPGAEAERAASGTAREAAAGARATVDGQVTILVVDDDPGTHKLMTENLKPLGARMLSATTGAGGLELARAEHPDLILLDVRLPDRQGWEVLHDLKADPATVDIPVIVVSVVDRESLGFSLGAADYIVKPVNWDHLYKVLGRLGLAPGGDVLVVDDDPEQVALLRRALESRGFTVREAHDGIQALAAARERRPGLVVLDLMMPVMDGFDTLTHLRSDPRTTGVPVVVLTAKDLTEADRARLGGKVDALFQKHRVPLDQLIGEVRSLVWRGGRA